MLVFLHGLANYDCGFVMSVQSQWKTRRRLGYTADGYGLRQGKSDSFNTCIAAVDHTIRGDSIAARRQMLMM